MMKEIAKAKLLITKPRMMRANSTANVKPIRKYKIGLGKSLAITTVTTESEHDNTNIPTMGADNFAIM